MADVYDACEGVESISICGRDFLAMDDDTFYYAAKKIPLGCRIAHYATDKEGIENYILPDDSAICRRADVEAYNAK